MAKIGVSTFCRFCAAYRVAVDSAHRARKMLRIVLAALLSLVAAVPARAAFGDPHDDKRRVDQQLAAARTLYEDAGATVPSAMAAYTAATAQLPAAQNRLADAKGTVAARQAGADQARRD